MPVPTETLWNMRRLNVVFGVTSVLGLLSFGWMMWHDYDRAWRHTQVEYFNTRSALAHFEYLAYQSPDMKAKHAALQQAVEQAERGLDRNALEERQKELATVSGELENVSLAYGNRNAEVQVTLFVYEESRTLHGDQDARTVALRARFDAEQEQVAALKDKKDRLEDRKRDLENQIKAIQADFVAARKELDAFEKGMNAAKRRDEAFGPGLARTILNLPILEYAPPHDIPGRQEIKQVFTHDVRWDYNFIDSYVTDRCITCHVAVDDPTFSRDTFVARAESALTTEAVSAVLRQENEQIIQSLSARLGGVDLSSFVGKDLSPAAGLDAEGEDRVRFISRLVSAANGFLDESNRPRLILPEIRRNLLASHLDRGRVVSEIEAQVRRILSAAPPTTAIGGEERRLAWAEMNPIQQDRYFRSLNAAMNTYLMNADPPRPQITMETVLTAHPRLDLFVSADSPHPMKKMGCTVCHEGSGGDTDFVLAAHSPKSREEKHEWEEKYYVKELGIPLSDFHIVEEYWERPMLTPSYYSASCVKCHDQVYDNERHETKKLDEAHNVVMGRELFTRVGCINCHNVQGLSDERRVGTDLTYVADKLSPGFMERWIEYPNNFRPSTRMPHFFHQENNLPSSANPDFDPQPVVRTETEIKAMTHYLRTFSRAFDALPLPEGLTGDAARGEALFTSIGCMACHANLDAKDPLDSSGRTLGERWIVDDLTHEFASAQVSGLEEQGVAVPLEQRQQALETARTRAAEVFAAMNKNDRVRYAGRRFSKENREKAELRRKTEAYLAAIEERDPDPLKTYLPPEFTRHGPELSGMGTKLIGEAGNVDQARRWLYNWLRDPRHYAANTVMPRMFRDNYHEDKTPAEQRALNDQEMLDVAEYLLSLKNDVFDPSPIPETPAHDEMKLTLIRDLLGGQNTASVTEKILNDEKFDSADRYGQLTASIVNQVQNSFGGGDAGRDAVETIIRARSDSLADRQKLYLGMKMISHYGCYACHTIAGFEDATRPGTELTTWAQKFMSQLDFAFFSPVFEHERAAKPDVFGMLYQSKGENGAAEFHHLVRDISETLRDFLPDETGAAPGGNIPEDVLHNHASFAYHKIRNPRIWDRGKYKKPYEKLKMPNYYFTEAESRAIVTYLLSRRDPGVRPGVKLDYDNTPMGKIARGRELAHELNCIGCHTIEGFAPATIHQFYSDDMSLSDDNIISQRFKPPLLWGEGAKVQPDWLFRFFNNVVMLRPWLKARMPSFYLTTEEATALVEYFAGLSRYESQMLRDRLAPVARYLQQVHAAHGDQPPPDTAWFAQEKFAGTAEFLKDFALSHKQTAPFAFDASRAGTQAERIEALAGGYAQALKRAAFLADVFDVAYPYNDTRIHGIGDERFKLGEAFFYDLRCLDCHVGGDPGVPGTTRDIKAPNFALTFERLQYDWVVQWLTDPQAIQPGANMPQIFPGATYHAQFGGKAQEAGEARYGRTMDEQSRLLVDFLFALGERRYTAIQPGAAEAQQQQEQAPEVEIDFDDVGEEKKEDEEISFD